VRLAHVDNVPPFQTRGAHVFAKRIFFKKDRIALLVVFLCDTEGAVFKGQVLKLLVGGLP